MGSFSIESLQLWGLRGVFNNIHTTIPRLPQAPEYGIMDGKVGGGRVWKEMSACSMFQAR